MNLKIEIDHEQDGRWIAEVPDLPGVMCYGQTRAEALSKVEPLALRVLADRIEHGEEIPAVAEAFTIPTWGNGDPAMETQARRAMEPDTFPVKV